MPRVTAKTADCPMLRRGYIGAAVNHRPHAWSTWWRGRRWCAGRRPITTSAAREPEHDLAPGEVRIEVNGRAVPPSGGSVLLVYDADGILRLPGGSEIDRG